MKQRTARIVLFIFFPCDEAHKTLRKYRVSSRQELYRALQNSANVRAMIDSLLHRRAVARERECNAARLHAVCLKGFKKQINATNRSYHLRPFRFILGALRQFNSGRYHDDWLLRRVAAVTQRETVMIPPPGARHTFPNRKGAGRSVNQKRALGSVHLQSLVSQCRVFCGVMKN